MAKSKHTHGDDIIVEIEVSRVVAVVLCLLSVAGGITTGAKMFSLIDWPWVWALSPWFLMIIGLAVGIIGSGLSED